MAIFPVKSQILDGFLLAFWVLLIALGSNAGPMYTIPATVLVALSFFLLIKRNKIGLYLTTVSILLVLANLINDYMIISKAEAGHSESKTVGPFIVMFMFLYVIVQLPPLIALWWNRSKFR